MIVTLKLLTSVLRCSIVVKMHPLARHETLLNNSNPARVQVLPSRRMWPLYLPRTPIVCRPRPQVLPLHLNLLQKARPLLLHHLPNWFVTSPRSPRSTARTVAKWVTYPWCVRTLTPPRTRFMLLLRARMMLWYLVRRRASLSWHKSTKLFSRHLHLHFVTLLTRTSYFLTVSRRSIFSLALSMSTTSTLLSIPFASTAIKGFLRLRLRLTLAIPPCILMSIAWAKSFGSHMIVPIEVGYFRFGQIRVWLNLLPLPRAYML